MKFLLIPVAALLLLVSCKDKKEGDKEKTTTGKEIEKPFVEDVAAVSLTGKWVLAEMKSDEEIPEEEKKKMIGVATIEFTADGKYTAHAPEDDEKGTYTYDAKTKILSTTSTDGDTDDVKAEFSSNKLTVTHEEASMVFRRAND